MGLMKKETPKYSDAGKGDKSRQSISPIEWEKRWEKIFKPQVSGSKTKNNTRKVK
tara:strand:- start:281 stop:445 length:165 start_codon:yes stop_codon:yes gene_type:complete